MLALLAVFSIFNYKFDKNAANVASVLAYFWYSIGRRLWPHPSEVLEAMRIKNEKKTVEKEEETKDDTVNANMRGVQPLDLDSETGSQIFSGNHPNHSFQRILGQRTRRKRPRRHLPLKMMPSWQRKKPLMTQVRQVTNRAVADPK